MLSCCPVAAAPHFPGGTHGGRGCRLSLPGDADHAHAHAQHPIIEPNEQPFDLDHLTSEILSRLEQLPPFRRRVLPPPFRLNHPLWLTDRPVELADHVFHHEVPAPGGMKGLEELIGRVSATPLDRSRPLWEMHVCQPFDDGRVAVVTKMHHALADGVAANALLGNLVDAPGDDVRPARERPRSDLGLESTPTRFEQTRMALKDAIGRSAVSGLVARTVRAIRSVIARRRVSEVDVPRPVLDVPRVVFDNSLTARRNFATCTLSVAEIKEAQRAHGVTLNDVVLAVVGGALRRWLMARGGCPRGHLWPECPWPRTSRVRHRDSAATGSRTCSPRWPPTSTTPASGCSPSPGRRESRRSSSARWGRTCSSTGSSSRPRLRSARRCGSAPVGGGVAAPTSVQPGGLERPGTW